MIEGHPTSSRELSLRRGIRDADTTETIVLFADLNPSASIAFEVDEDHLPSPVRLSSFASPNDGRRSTEFDATLGEHRAPHLLRVRCHASLPSLPNEREVRLETKTKVRSTVAARLTLRFRFGFFFVLRPVGHGAIVRSTAFAFSLRKKER